MFKLKIVIFLILFGIQTNIFSSEKWISWSLGTASMDYQFISEKYFLDFNFLSINNYNPDINIGFSITGFSVKSEITDGVDENYKYAVLPIEFFYTPINYEYGGLEIYTEAAVILDNNRVYPELEIGVRLGVLIEPEVDAWYYYAPKFSVNSVYQPVFNDIKAGVDMDLGILLLLGGDLLLLTN